MKYIDESSFCRERFAVLQNYLNVDKIELMFSPSVPGIEPEDVCTALQTLQLNTKPKLTFLDLTLLLDHRLHPEALNVFAESTGALRRFHVMAGRQSRYSWDAIASANPFLEEVAILLFLGEAEDFSAGGQRAGEMWTFRGRFGEEEGRTRRDEFISKALMGEGLMPFRATLDADREGFSTSRFQYDDSEIIYFGYGRVVTEEEALDILQSFSLCRALRVLEICDVDENQLSGKVTFTSKKVHDACIPVRNRRDFVPYVRIPGKNYI